MERFIVEWCRCERHRGTLLERQFWEPQVNQRGGGRPHQTREEVLTHRGALAVLPVCRGKEEREGTLKEMKKSLVHAWEVRLREFRC